MAAAEDDDAWLEAAIAAELAAYESSNGGSDGSDSDDHFDAPPAAPAAEAFAIPSALSALMDASRSQDGARQRLAADLEEVAGLAQRSDVLMAALSAPAAAEPASEPASEPDAAPAPPVVDSDGGLGRFRAPPEARLRMEGALDVSRSQAHSAAAGEEHSWAVRLRQAETSTASWRRLIMVDNQDAPAAAESAEAPNAIYVILDADRSPEADELPEEADAKPEEGAAEAAEAPPAASALTEADAAEQQGFDALLSHYAGVEELGEMEQEFAEREALLNPKPAAAQAEAPPVAASPLCADQAEVLPPARAAEDAAAAVEGAAAAAAERATVLAAARSEEVAILRAHLERQQAQQQEREQMLSAAREQKEKNDRERTAMQKAVAWHSDQARQQAGAELVAAENKAAESAVAQAQLAAETLAREAESRAAQQSVIQVRAEKELQQVEEHRVAREAADGEERQQSEVAKAEREQRRAVARQGKELYASAVASLDESQMTAAVEQLEKLIELHGIAEQGRQLAAQWRSTAIQRLRAELDRAASSSVQDVEALMLEAAHYEELSEQVEALRSQLRRAEQVGVVRENLTTAIARRDTQLLGSSLTDGQSCDELKDLVTKGLAHQAAWTAEPVLQSKLKHALDVKSIVELQDVVTAADAHSPLLDELVATCRGAISAIQSEGDAQKLLTDARLTCHPDTMASALRQVANVSTPQIRDLAELCSQDLKRWQLEAHLRADMSAAIAARDQTELLVLRCQAEALPALNDDVKLAEAAVRRWDLDEQQLRDIRDSVARRDLKQLKSALSAAGYSDYLQTEVAAGRAEMLKISEENTALESLDAACQGARVPELASAIEVVQRYTLEFALPKVQAAQALMAQWERREGIEAAIAAATQQHDSGKLQLAIRSATDADDLGSSLKRASETRARWAAEDAIVRELRSATEEMAGPRLESVISEAGAFAESSPTAVCEELTKAVESARACLSELAIRDHQRVAIWRAMARADDRALDALHESASRTAPDIRKALSRTAPIQDPMIRSHAISSAASEGGKRTQSLTPLVLRLACGEASGATADAMEHWQSLQQFAPLELPESRDVDIANHIRPQKADFGLEELSEVQQFEHSSSLLSLSMNVNRITNVEQLQHCTSLQELSLNDNRISELSAVATLSCLRKLSIDVNRLSSLATVGQCTQLRSVSASHNVIASLDGVEECRDLEKVVLYRNMVSSMGPLAPLVWLQHVDLGRNRLSAVTGLSNAPLLLTLILYENQITEMPTDSELGTPLLRELWLSGNPIKSLQFTAWLPMLDALHVSDAQISEVSPLRGCSLLRTLDLSFNRLSSLADLDVCAACKQIEILRLNDNPLAEVGRYRQVLVSGLPALRELDNEPVTETRRRVMQSSLGSSSYVFSTMLSRLRAAPNRGGQIDWNSLCREIAPLMFSDFMAQENDATAAWASRTHGFMCHRQRGEYASLAKAQKRRAACQPSEHGTGYDNELAEQESGFGDMRELLVRHHAEHTGFAPQSHQLVFTRSSQYTARANESRARRACVAIQASWRGAAVRAAHRRVLDGAARQIQDMWRARAGDVQRKNGIVAAKIQASFRGFKVRRRLNQALESAKYYDSDEDEYGGVDELDFAMPEMHDDWDPFDGTTGGEPMSFEDPGARATANGPPPERSPQRPPQRPPQPTRQFLATPESDVLDQDLDREQRPHSPGGLGRSRGFGGGAAGGGGDYGAGADSGDDDEASNEAHSVHKMASPKRATASAAAVDQAAAWGIKDPKVIAAMRKKAAKYQRMGADKKRRESKQSASHRIASFRRTNGGGTTTLAPRPPSGARSAASRRGKQAQSDNLKLPNIRTQQLDLDL